MRSRKRLAAVLLAYAGGICLLALPRCARAAEPPVEAAPCRDEGASVVCEAAAFGRLVHQLLDCREEAARCSARLRDCELRPPPLPPALPVLTLPPPPAPPPAVVVRLPSIGRPLTAVALAAAGGAAILTSATLADGATPRAVWAGAGLLSLGVATVLATW